MAVMGHFLMIRYLKGLNDNIANGSISFTAHHCHRCDKPVSSRCIQSGHVGLCDAPNCGKRFNMPQGCPTHRNREGYNVVARCLESLGSGRRREADLIADLDGYAKANGIVADKDDPATSRFGGRAGINAEDSSSTERLFDEEAAEYDNATGQSLDSAEELRICMNKFSIEEKGLQQRQTIDPNKKSRKARYDPLEEIKQPQVDKGFDMYANKSFSEAVAEPRDSTPKSENKKQQKKELVLKAAEKRAKKFGTSRSKIKARKDKQNVVLVEEEEELRI